MVSLNKALLGPYFLGGGGIGRGTLGSHDKSVNPMKSLEAFPEQSGNDWTFEISYFVQRPCLGFPKGVIQAKDLELAAITTRFQITP